MELDDHFYNTDIIFLVVAVATEMIDDTENFGNVSTILQNLLNDFLGFFLAEDFSSIVLGFCNSI